jgi:hypothetical protein
VLRVAAVRFPTREEWLRALLVELRPTFVGLGKPVPEKIRVACGWPISGGRPGGKRTTIGQCFYAENSADETTEVFVSPILDDPLVVAATLAHETAHAALGAGFGHGPQFASLARAVGLAGKPTSTVAGPEFEEWAAPVLASLGPYPHSKMDPARGRTKQSTRLVKVFCPECEAREEPYIVRMSRGAIERGFPVCPCGCEMTFDVASILAAGVK